MKITKGTISFVLGAAAGLLGLKLITDIKTGEDSDPTNSVAATVYKTRGENAIAVINDYEGAKAQYDILVRTENRKVKEITNKLKEKIGYDEKVSAVRRNTTDLIDSYKESIKYDENVKKVKDACDEKIKEAKEKARISFRLSQNEMEQRKVKNSYDVAKLGFSIIGGENEVAKNAVKEAEKQRDAELKRLKDERKSIEKESREIRERFESERDEELGALRLDLEAREETYKSMARTDLDQLDKQILKETERARELVESNRSEADLAVVKLYDNNLMRYNTLCDIEQHSIKETVDAMDDNDRAACYLAQAGWTKTSVQVVLFGGIAAVCYVVAGPVVKFVKRVIDISNRIPTYA